MTQEQHPITPPDELVEKWSPSIAIDQATAKNFQVLATQAARWGADQELEACCEHVSQWFATPKYRVAELRAARRPKPPSLKEQALEGLDLLTADATTHGLGFDASAIRRALESLPD